MLTILKKRSGDDRGSIMLLGLAFLGFVVVPLIAILWYLSLATTASQVARGTSLSAAYSGLSRSLDHSTSLTANQPQLYQIGSGGLKEAELEVEEATQLTWNYSGMSRMLPGAELTSEELPAFEGYGDPSAEVGSLGTVNILSDPQNAYRQAGQDCTSAGGLKNPGSGIVCWVNHRAFQDGENSRFHITDDAWDHYSSGVETHLRLTIPSLLRGDSPFEPLFRSSASIAQPCLGIDCAQ